jgi:hypothetical protein
MPESLKKEYASIRTRMFSHIERIERQLHNVHQLEQKLQLDSFELLLMQVVADEVKDRMETSCPPEPVSSEAFEELSGAVETCEMLTQEIDGRIETIEDLLGEEIDPQKILNRGNLSSLVLGRINGRILKVADFVPPRKTFLN